jgi:hypothetical protein
MRKAMKERRSRARQKSFLKGHIYFDEGRSCLDCLVRNLSSLGAKLTVSNLTELPDLIEVSIPKKKKTYPARILWRGNDEIGVSFSLVNASPSVVPADPGIDMIGRMRWLETEVLELQRKVNELRAELRTRQSGDI